MDITSMISVFETISNSLGGLDPSTFIGLPSNGDEAKEFIKNCLVKQMIRNTGLTEDDVEYVKKLEELDKQAAAMIEDPNSGEKLVEDMKTKLKESASGAQNACKKMKEMPNKITSLATEAATNFSSISSNPMTINCLPSAVASFVQSLNSIKTELATTMSNAVNSLKQLDDLGLSSLNDTISTQDYDNVTNTITKGMASCPESIKLDYDNTTSIFTANSVSFPNLTYINNTIFRSYLDLDRCVYTKANDSDIFCSSITLYYDTDKIDNLVKQGNIYDSLYNRLSQDEIYPYIYTIYPTRIIIDRKSSDTITTRILCTSIKSNDQVILPIDSSHTNDYTDEMGYYTISVDIYKYDRSSASLSEYRMMIIPKVSQYQNINNRSYLLYKGSRVAGIYIMYDGDYITVNSDNNYLFIINNDDTLLKLYDSPATTVTWRKFYRSKISDNCQYNTSEIIYNNTLGYLSSYQDTTYSITTLVDTTITNTKIDRDITTSISTQYLKVSDTSYRINVTESGSTSIYYNYYSIANSEFGEGTNHDMIRTDSFYIVNNSVARTNSYKIDMTIDSTIYMYRSMYFAIRLSKDDIAYPSDDSINNMTPNDLPWSNVKSISISDTKNQLTDFHVKCSWYKEKLADTTTIHLVPRIDIIYFNIREDIDLSKVDTTLSINGISTVYNVLHIKYNESDSDLRLGGA
jgi:gas vesicle protein